MSTMILEEAMASFLKKHEESMASHKAQMLRWDEDRRKADEERRRADEEYKEERRKADLRFEQISRLGRTYHKIAGIDFEHLSIDELIEIILLPKITEEINKFGHQFYMLSPNKKFHTKDDKVLMITDLMLENSDEAMVIEIQEDFTVEGVTRHVKP